ncbi:MAG: miaA [Candidatus Eremiobacteraeota bacterium]|nr:miaA [Candidatus Eremiobacteraeota bacterium]
MSAGVLILTGQTASGKSALALELAERFGAEIVGADSRQIYRGMPVGTAAPSEADGARVPHHLVGFLDPRERYSAARFVADALAAIDAIHARGRRALVVGGTGFYVRALTGDVALSPAYDASLRERLAREARIHPPEALAQWLHALAPQRATAIAPNDPYRITRALEIALAERSGSGLRDSRSRAQSDDNTMAYPDGAITAAAETASVSAGDGNVSIAAMNLRTRGVPYAKLHLDIDPDTLQRRIESRVDAMLANGLLDEAERVGADAVAADAVGYREALAFLAGWSTRDELRAQLVRNTRRYAKRQATWFRTEPGLVRVDAAGAAARAVALAGALPGWA